MLTRRVTSLWVWSVGADSAGRVAGMVWDLSLTGGHTPKLGSGPSTDSAEDIYRIIMHFILQDIPHSILQDTPHTVSYRTHHAVSYRIHHALRPTGHTTLQDTTLHTLSCLLKPLKLISSRADKTSSIVPDLSEVGVKMPLDRDWIRYGMEIFKHQNGTGTYTYRFRTFFKLFK